MSYKLVKKGKHLLLSGILAGIWLWAMPAQSQRSQRAQPAQQVSDAQVNAMVEALRKAAPENRANDGLYSDWQVKPAIISSWTKQCVGREIKPEEFESDAAAARDTVACIVKRELNNQYRATNNQTASVRNVACWWMTGTTTGCNSGATASYVQKVAGFYQQQAQVDKPATQQPAAKPSPKPTTSPSPEATDEASPEATTSPSPEATTEASPEETTSPSPVPSARPSGPSRKPTITP